ncbi:MAG: putative dehydrogenase [Marinoscillum sp.]
MLSAVIKEMKRTIKWGILGPGNIASKFADDLILVADAELVAVGSRDLTKSEAFALKYAGKRAYGNYEDLVTDEEVEIVYIATPHPFHFEHTMLCLENGKSVLCEKPLAMNSRQVTAMTDLARAKNLFLMEGMWTRFLPTIEHVLSLINSGKIGTINHLTSDFGFAAKPDKLRLFKNELGGGALLDIGIYPLYMSLLFLGVPSKLEANATITEANIDTFCAMMLDYGSSKALLNTTILNNTPVETRIYGEKGAIIMHGKFHEGRKITVTLHDGFSEEIDLPPTGHGFYHEILETGDCLRKGEIESPKMPWKSSHQLIGLLDLVREKIGLRFPADI